ncbi:MAG TPA: universal stress protein [Kofleriaceae bacterium]|jgi:nucleotide-binding universal stress UspA family protein|nr:universal stress protein [Kofleriaceae bacterium]
MTFTKILCPIDFSSDSQQAMRVAIRLANEANAELVLTHAWYLPAISYAGEYTFSPEVIQQMTDDAERGLDEATREATTLGAGRVTSKLLAGVPWQQIVETLEQDRAFDLVVMGTRGRTGLSRILLGSVAQDVIRHAPCSVLAVHPGNEPTPLYRVLCPVDFSAGSQYAVDLAAGLTQPGGAGITLAHVIELPVAYAGEPFVPEFARDLDKASAKLLDEWAARLRSKVLVPVVTRTRIGSPGAQTLAILDDDPTFDLVVMGSHGRTGIPRMLLGSVAEKVVRHAKCPVLVARKRG